MAPAAKNGSRLGKSAPGGFAKPAITVLADSNYSQPLCRDFFVVHGPCMPESRREVNETANAPAAPVIAVGTLPAIL